MTVSPWLVLAGALLGAGLGTVLLALHPPTPRRRAMTAWTVLATCGPAAIIGLWWFRQICADYVEAGRITARRIPMPDLPDDIGITPATGTRPAILWARHGNTTEFYPVHDTPRADTETADHEEPQP